MTTRSRVNFFMNKFRKLGFYTSKILRPDLFRQMSDLRQR